MPGHLWSLLAHGRIPLLIPPLEITKPDGLPEPQNLTLNPDEQIFESRFFREFSKNFKKNCGKKYLFAEKPKSGRILCNSEN